MRCFTEKRLHNFACPPKSVKAFCFHGHPKLHFHAKMAQIQASISPGWPKLADWDGNLASYIEPTQKFQGIGNRRQIENFLWYSASFSPATKWKACTMRNSCSPISWCLTVLRQNLRSGWSRIIAGFWRTWKACRLMRKSPLLKWEWLFEEALK